MIRRPYCAITSNGCRINSCRGTWSATRQHQTLAGMGHVIETKEIGCRVRAVELDVNKINAVSDPRGEGSSYAF